MAHRSIHDPFRTTLRVVTGVSKVVRRNWLTGLPKNDVSGLDCCSDGASTARSADGLGRRAVPAFARGGIGDQAGEELALEVQASTGHAIRTRVAIPALLSNPSAHRAPQCVLFLAEHPQASNREIASGVGVAHASQISKLLSCLLGEWLVARHSAGAGKRNAWWLTAHGGEVARALRAGSGRRLVWEGS